MFDEVLGVDLFQIPGTTRAGTKGGSPDEVVERLSRREKQLRKMIDVVRQREREREEKRELKHFYLQNITI